MRLRVVLADRPSCNVALHAADSTQLFAGLGATRHFCRALRLEKEGTGVRFVGWVGDTTLAKGTLELAKPFADCLGLREGDELETHAARDAVVAAAVMVQPDSSDDWEVVELQAGYIEQNLLSQVAVLTPGMVFPVWIHGQMPVRLRVDARDENQTECFLLARDSELMIESKQRAREERPMSLFGKAGEAGDGHPSSAEPRLRLRVLALASDLDGPIGKVHVEDLERLAGYVARDGCLAWLTVKRLNTDSRGAQLIRLVVDEAVPRGQIVIGTCLATHSEVPCFSLVSLTRCRQVPVYVPELELVPLGNWASSKDAKSRRPNLDFQNARWLDGLFKDFVQRMGEVDLMEGVVVQLRSKDEPSILGNTSDQTTLPGQLPIMNGVGKDCKGLLGGSSDSTDLYDDLSDIDDIYQTTGQTCEITNSGLGVFELDLGLDEEVSTPSQDAGHSVHARLQSRPSVLAVRVQFALGETRAAMRHDVDQPPFVRLTHRALEDDVCLSVHWPSLGTGGAPTENVDALTLLWQATPGLHELPVEEISCGAIQVVPCGGVVAAGEPLDSLKLYSEPAYALKANLLSQLGCLPQPTEDDANASSSRPRPCEPNTIASCSPGAVAVIGGTGSGKTMLCRRVLVELAREGVLPIQVSCTKLGQPSRKFKSVQERLQDILRIACRHSPSVVLFDDFGALCPDVEPGAPNLSIVEERSPILSELLLDLLPALRGSGARVALCATLPSDAAAHRALWKPPALEHKIALRSPLLKERPDILQILLRKKVADGWQIDETLLHEGALDGWGGRVDGFSVADLAGLVHRACVEAESEAGTGLLAGTERIPNGDALCEQPRLALRHLERATEGFVPSSMADQTFLSSDVKLSDIGGMHEPKQELMDMLTMPTKYAVLMDRSPVRGRKGMMLVGPPGCGKTFLVQAAAHETKGLLRFLTVKGPELLSKYIGESEAGVRRVFERAAAAAPAVIFFDEIEALAPKRGADSTGVTDRVVNQMLCYLDGVEDRGRVYVIAASGRPDLVDPALLRPGRFDRICYCGIPSDEEKLELCEILATKNGLVVGGEQGDGGLQDALRHLVSQLPRLFTSADLNGLFSSAKIEAVNELLAQGPAGSKQTPSMSMAHLHTALSTAKASISEADEQRYNKVFEAYRPGTKQSALQRTGPETLPGKKVALA
mmetsp:Transcript_90179/g.291501  ORF Transcript_90179/g.291501 Transcript_90179/m.291501 type:complete len:1174 (-) Transcript_90179:225-3746(-)